MFIARQAAFATETTEPVSVSPRSRTPLELVWKSRRPADPALLAMQRARPLVQRIAWSVYSRITAQIEYEDLVQIGLLAVIAAPAEFEDRGPHCREAWLRTRIRGAMLDALRQQSPLSRGCLRFRRMAAAAQDALRRETGREPAEADIAARCGMKLPHFRARSRASVMSVRPSHCAVDPGKRNGRPVSRHSVA